MYTVADEINQIKRGNSLCQSI